MIKRNTSERKKPLASAPSKPAKAPERVAAVRPLLLLYFELLLDLLPVEALVPQGLARCVGEELVGVVNFLELLLGLLLLLLALTTEAVGVPLHGGLLIRFFEGLLVRMFVEVRADELVEVRSLGFLQ